MEKKKSTKKERKIIRTLLLILSFFMFSLGALLIIRQYVYMPGLLTFFGIREPYLAPPIVVVPTPSPLPPDVTPTPYVKKAPVKLYFLDRNISSDIEPVGLLENNAIGTVDDPYISAWYKDGASPADEEGNAIINGHVRWGGIAGTFAILPELKENEEILVEFEDHTQKRFYVAETHFFPFDGVPTEMLSQDGDFRLTLISCHGEWNSDAGTSSQRVFVICKPK